MNKKSGKPITIVREEFISSLISLVNESGLPPFIMESILKDVYLEVKDASKKQYEFDLANYKSAKNKIDEK